MELNSSSEDDEEIRNWKIQMKQLEKKIQQKKSQQKTTHEMANTSQLVEHNSFLKQNEEHGKTQCLYDQEQSTSSPLLQSTSSLENQCTVDDQKCKEVQCPTYKKLPGAVDHGKEYEQIMCAFYALKLLTSDEVENFEMTTNNKEHGVFDDIGFKVIFKNKTMITYLIQLKHKENAKSITKKHLYTGKQKGDFDVEKYFKSMSSDIRVTQDVVCIISTNSPTNIQNSINLSKNINIKVCDYVEHENILINTRHRNDNSIFQVIATENNQMFYLFTEQNNIHNTKTQVEEMLRNLVQSDIYGTFIHFIIEWWLQNFVLSKDDIIAKMTDLAFSPFVKTLNSGKQNDKTVHLTQAILDFQITIVDNSDGEDIIEGIWQTENLTQEDFGKIKKKFLLKTTEQDKLLWYLDKMPLVVKMNSSNETMVKHVAILMNKAVKAKKIVLVGQASENHFEGLDVFRNFSDLIKKSENKSYCRTIIDTFEMSLQGRKAINLDQVIKVDQEIAKHVGVNELLKMSQGKYIIGQHIEELPHLHIPRSVSTVFVKTEKIFSSQESLRNQDIIIINYDPTFKNKSLEHQNFVEISEILAKKTNENESGMFISKCTHKDFSQICKKFKNSNVYLFQIFDKEFSILLLNKGNKLPKEFIHSKRILEKDILHYFNNTLNIICAPPGMGKSTLMKVLYKNCPSDFWAIYVDLINCNSFLTKTPNFKTIRDHFLGLKEGKEKTFEKEIKITLWQNNRIHLYLDGLDEVDSSYVDRVLDFATKASSNGIKIWISSRENLRDRISQTLNVVPIDIQDLDTVQREEYIHEKLKKTFKKKEIENILKAIFDSVDLNNSQQLLGIPLQLHIITEIFLNNHEVCQQLEQRNIFVLTQMYKLFFEGKIESTISKLIDENKNHLLQYLKASLKLFEIPALKACLDNKDFQKLNLSLEESEEFIKYIRNDGDIYGIIKKVNDNGDAIFDHQTYAEYFACVWLKGNKEKTLLLRKEMFSKRYENLRLMFDIMLAENNALHLAIIYKNLEQFENHINETHIKDLGGRRALHLICTYGVKYVVPYVKQRFPYTTAIKEASLYIEMISRLIQQENNVYIKDALFDFDCINYALEARCVYPIEIMLENDMLAFKQIKDALFKSYPSNDLAFYAAQMGYPNLLSALISDNPELLFEKINDECLLETAVMESEYDIVTKPREGNIAVVKALLKGGFSVNKSIVFDGYQRSRNILDLACHEGKYDMINVLVENGAKCTEGNTVWHRLAQSFSYIDVTNIHEESIEVINSINTELDVHAKNYEGLTVLQTFCRQENFLVLNGQQAWIHMRYTRSHCRKFADGIKSQTERSSYKNFALEFAKMLLESDASINVLDEQNNSLLHYALEVWKDNRDIIKLLIEKGIDINVPNRYGTTPLQLACKNGDFEITKILLEKNFSIHVLDNEDNNVLHYASQSHQENLDIIKLLIDERINVNATNKNGTSPLSLAIYLGHFNIIKVFIENGAWLNILDKNNNNTLHYALKAYRVKTDLVQLLIENGISVNAQNNNRKTPLHFACHKGNFEISKLLIENGALINILDEDYHNAMHYTYGSWESNRNLIKLLIEQNIDVNIPNKNGKTTLEFAIENDDLEIAEMLLQHGAAINDMNENIHKSFLYALVFRNSRNVFKLLIDKRFVVNVWNKNYQTLLFCVVKQGDYEITKILLDKGASINDLDKSGNNALHSALLPSTRANEDIIKFLIDKDINVNIKNKEGKTALHLAAEQGNFEISKMLLENKAAINDVDKNDNNALHLASQSQNPNLITLLIDSGIDANAVNKNGTTALHFASRSGNFEIATMLLNNDALINVLDKQMNNALHYASESRKYNLNIIQLLIDNGFDLNARNKDGLTAVHLACKSNNCANAKLLLENDDWINVLDKDGNNVLHHTSQSMENPGLIQILIDKGISVNAQNKHGKTALHLACEPSNFKNAKTLIQNNASVNIRDKENNTALHYALQTVISDSKHLTKLLLNVHIIDINARNSDGKTALSFALLKKDFESSQTLLKKNASIYALDHDMNNALHYLLKYWSNGSNWQSMIDLLIFRGIDVNAQNDYRETPLQIACKNKKFYIILYLLESSNSLNVVDKNNNNALHCALQSQIRHPYKQRTVKSLIERGLDANAPNNYGSTALHIACKEGDLENTETLLRSGASINLLDGDNNNCLHYAVDSDRVNTKIVELLIDEGIEVNASNTKGETALAIACGWGHLDTIKILLRNHASTNILDKEGNNALHYAIQYDYESQNKSLVNVLTIENDHFNTGDVGNNRKDKFLGKSDIVQLLIDNDIDINVANKNGKTPLHISCQNDHYEITKILLENKAVTNLLDENNKNALHYASSRWEENRDIIKLLIHGGINVNIPNKNGTTTFQLACKNADMEIVLMLLENNASIDDVDKDENNAFHYASSTSKDNRDVLKLLVEKDINVNSQNKNGITALHIACKKGVYENVEFLFSKQAEFHILDKDDNNALHFAIQAISKDSDIIDLLINKGIDVETPNRNGFTPLLLACKLGDFNCIEILLRHGVKCDIIDKNRNNALHHTVQFGNDDETDLTDEYSDSDTYESNESDDEIDLIAESEDENVQKQRNCKSDIIKLLIDKNVDIHATNNNMETPLHFSCGIGDYEISKILLENNASTNVLDKEDNNPLHYGLKSLISNKDVIKALIDKNIDVNAANISGTTALHLACRNGNFEITEILLEHSASLNVLDVENQNALHYALQFNRINSDVIKLLVSKGIDINTANKNGTTPLQLACEEDNYDIAEMLLNNRASINVLDKDNHNALHCMLIRGSDSNDLLNLLIKRGIELKAPNKHKTTALHLACENCDFEIVKTLIRNDASIDVLDEDNNNAIHYASRSRRQNRHAIMFLIERGFDVNAPNKHGTTALQFACKAGNLQNTQKLLKNGASINVLDSDNNNALHYASQSHSCNKDVIKLLINEGINVNSLNMSGSTALHLACHANNTRNVKELLNNGANVNALDNIRKTPLDYAISQINANCKLIKMLETEMLKLKVELA